uniref:Bactericidal permeability-increasing protein n=1 Tax=Mola mola TaxID=94237 RepID=A0A3Q3WXW6_MOLML
MLPHMMVALTLMSLTCGETPAVQVILTNKGLQYGKDACAAWIQDRLELITFPDISGDIQISIFGSIDYTLTGTTITKCDFPDPSVEFYEDYTGFKTSISGLSVAVTGEIMAQWGIIKYSGSFNMAILGVDVTSVLELGKDADGRLSVTSVSCDARIEDVDIQLNGGFRPAVKIFSSEHCRIFTLFTPQICPTVKDSIVNLEYHLQAMNVSFDVNQDITVDLPLTNLSFISASSLNLGLKGEFYSTKMHTEPPFEPQPFMVPEQTGYMLSLGFSEFTLNSASFGYYSAGLLQLLVNDSMIPSLSPVRLNTSSMGSFIPQLPKMYPGLLMDLQVYARDIPLFSFRPGVVELDLQGAIKAFAIQSNGTHIPLFKLNADSKLSGKVWIADGRLKGSMGMNNFTLTLAASDVGPFKRDNDRLGKGIYLPRLKHAELVNTVLEVDTVSFNERHHINVSVWPAEENGIMWIKCVFLPNRAL